MERLKCLVCSPQLLQYRFIISNLILFAGGGILFAISMIAFLHQNFLDKFYGTDLLSYGLNILIVTSALSCLLAFLGYYSAKQKVKWMLSSYFIISFVVFIAMIIGSSLCFIFREKVKLTMKLEMYSSLKFYDSHREITNSWDWIQMKLKCCGVDTYKDWFKKLPQSCCQANHSEKRACQEEEVSIVYSKGCYESGLEFIADHSLVIGSTGLINGVFLLLGMIFSFIDLT